MMDIRPPLVELVVEPRLRDLAGLTVNRVWPTARRRLIGPFVFFDHMQRAMLAPGVGLDVPPHPHIGLATVTYLFEGEIVHRDSLGYEQVIRPGELNWMTAGRGIVHSERTGLEQREAASVVHGIQSWVALPRHDEACAPTFEHYGAEAMPSFSLGKSELRLVAGAAFGHVSPVRTHSALFYVEADCAAGAVVALDVELGQRAVYIVEGKIRIGDERYEAGRLLVLADGAHVDVSALEPARLMLLGGAPLDGERHVWWNFVSSSRERIEAAKADWQARRFPEVPGDDGYLPLPG